VLGRTVGRWLNTKTATPTIFFSDSQDCLLASVSGPEDSPVPWQDAEARGVDIYGQTEESPLNLVPADEKRGFSRVSDLMMDDSSNRLSGGSGGSDELAEDTFFFRRFESGRNSRDS